MTQILTGMSGYAYKEWKPDFYPAKLPAAGFLGHYATRFPTVEINNTFYRMPKDNVLQDWAGQVPDGFTFCLKASRRITHDNRLSEVDSLLEYVLRGAAVLGAKRGPMLFQLPPNMKKDIARLETFLALIPAGVRTALECRHASWFEPDVYDLLRRREVALVATEQEDWTGPVVATANWGYVRLHRSGYTDELLHRWKDVIATQGWKEAFVFFKHEEEIAGPPIGLRFQSLTNDENHGSDASLV
jgi:uncharacterized protein YecE (DUF72 family)